MAYQGGVSQDRIVMAVGGTWDAERIARLLPKAHKTPTGWKACCPSHEDKNPSLFIADGADGIAMRCYAGCTYRQILEALTGKGVELASPVDLDGYPTNHYQLGEPHQKWEYRDASGRVVMLVCRWNQPGGRKDIRPLVRTADGWKWQHHPTPRPLYNLDQLTNEPERPVYVVEGEKAAAAAQKLFPRVVVTTWPGGAQSVGQADWSALAGRDVTLVPDCDRPGIQAMQWVAKALSHSAQRVRTVNPRSFTDGLPDGWDLADALAEKREVGPWFTEQAPEPKVRRLRWLHEVLANPTTPRWLLDDVLEAGVIALISGPRGSFKSFVAIHWAMQVAVNGEPVVLVSAEGAGFDRRAAAWLSKYANGTEPKTLTVAVLEQRVNFYDAESASQLCEEIDELGICPAILVIDTLSKNSGALKESDNSEVKVFIGILDGVRRKYGCTIVLVHHTGHAELTRARGASALEADTDAAYVINRPTKDPIVSVSRERFKDSSDLPPLSYRAEIIDLGRIDDRGKPITSLALSETADVDVNSTGRKAPRGTQQKQFMRMLRGLQDTSEAAGKGEPIWTIHDLRELAKSSGMAKSSAREVVVVATQHYLIATVGGYRLARKGEDS